MFTLGFFSVTGVRLVRIAALSLIFVKMDVQLLVLVISSFLPCSDAVVYYISADPITSDTCVDNSNATLRPCYSLQQLSNGNGLLVNKTSITLLLLSGTHVLPEDCTLLLSDIGEVEISPWNQQQEELIKCHVRANITFQHIKKLNIFSLNFTYCVLFLNHTVKVDSNFKAQAAINQCVFAGSKENYAITIAKTSIKLNISVNNSPFLSNDGALSCDCRVIDSFKRILIRNTMFMNNTKYGSGTLNVSSIDIELHGSSFINNTASAVSLESCSALITKTHFLNNHAYLSGGAISLSNSRSYFHHCVFKNNSGDIGGAIFSLGYLSVVNTGFSENYAGMSGGAIYARSNRADIDSCQFKNNFAKSGGAIHFYDTEEINLSYTLFHLNKAGRYGGAIYCTNSLDSLREDVYIDFVEGNSTMNSAKYGGFLYSKSYTVSIHGTYYIFGNRATNGGAFFTSNSEVLIPAREIPNHDPELSFINNTAENSGGAIYAIDSHILVDASLSQMTFSSNAAAGRGGAIYISDDHCESIKVITSDCSIDCFSHRGVQSMFFFNNSATYGPILYGGLLDRCYHDRIFNYTIYDFKASSEYDEQTPLAITSDPVKICFCLSNFQLECTKRDVVYKAMRGETLEAIVTSVDQDENPVPSVIRIGYEKTTASLGEGEGRNRLNNSCTALRFHIFTVDLSAWLILQPEGVCERSPLSNLTILIQLMNCSRGFEQSKDRCVCDRRLRQYLNVTNCLLATQSVERRGPIWLRYEENSLKMSRNCPLNYCQATSDSISLLAPDDPCANHRSGILCGTCQHNYSIALGGSRCLPCTEKKYAFIWLILVFAVAGVALVALLLVCNMTISHGTLNGLIFYANVVSMSGLTSLHNCSIHPILSVSIAWLNLNFGVETCFYPGMDTYQKTWLQFAFPLYIVLLVIAILVASYYSSTAMKVFGRNNIAILATLFLLSYSKTLKTIVSALSASQVLASVADIVSAPVLPYTVWSYDGNVEYLKGEHIVLFTVAVVFLVVLFLPYTLLLTFGQCLRSLPLRRRWILRLTRSTAFISIMDAYHAPYNRNHRYWTGLMLLTRCVLFLSFATNYSSDQALVNSYITALVVSGILIIKTCSTEVYTKFWNSLLELSFLVNLVILSITLCYLQHTSINDNSVICKSTTASISISFITFIGIVAHHAHLQIEGTKWYKSAKLVVLKKFPVQQHLDIPADDSAVVLAPTTTFVELREVLLASSK